MKFLITGAAGFAGAHLINELTTHGHECIATDLAIERPLPGAAACASLDIRDRSALDELIRRIQPEACIHLAGITYVPDGASNPDLMLSVNIRGTTNLLHGLRIHAPNARLLTVSTAHVYGVGPRGAPLSEDAPLRPLSLYAISKAAADIATLAFTSQHRLHGMVARPNNHTGPGQQSRFVAGAFAGQVRDIAAGRAAPRISVGNLDSERDFMDVRDVVRAYRLIVEQGQPGQAYNIASDNTVRIGDMLDTLCRLAGVAPELKTDPELVRPTDWSPSLDTSRLVRETGWAIRIPFEQTLRDMLDETA